MICKFVVVKLDLLFRNRQSGHQHLGILEQESVNKWFELNENNRLAEV